MAGKEKMTSVENFMNSNGYKKAIYAENSDDYCKNCSLMFVFDGQTRCYAYEQQRCKDKDLIFHPQGDFNCVLFSDDGICGKEIEYYIKALKKGVDPQNDDEYCKALKESNDYYDSLDNIEKENKNEIMITNGMIQIHMHIVVIGKMSQKTACVVQTMTVH